MNLYFMCSNETVTEPEMALELQMNFQTFLNISVHNFVISAEVNDPVFLNTVVVEDNVGMYYHDYDTLLTSILVETALNFNIVHSTGTDLKDRFPTLKFVNGLLKNSYLTPYMEDEFIYGGFSWITDFGETTS